VSIQAVPARWFGFGTVRDLSSVVGFEFECVALPLYWMNGAGTRELDLRLTAALVKEKSEEHWRSSMDSDGVSDQLQYGIQDIHMFSHAKTKG
jgi:hypothetical protein